MPIKYNYFVNLKRSESKAAVLIDDQVYELASSHLLAPYGKGFRFPTVVITYNWRTIIHDLSDTY